MMLTHNRILKQAPFRGKVLGMSSVSQGHYAF